MNSSSEAIGGGTRGRQFQRTGRAKLFPMFVRWARLEAASGISSAPGQIRGKQLAYDANCFMRIACHATLRPPSVQCSAVLFTMTSMSSRHRSKTTPLVSILQASVDAVEDASLSTELRAVTRSLVFAWAMTRAQGIAQIRAIYNREH
ncbi:hypothetical protein SCUP234_10221 [Seiridium cupressi]